MIAQPPPVQANRGIANLAILGVMLIVLFAAVLWLVGVQGVADTPESAGSSLSGGQRGTLAMYRWLERSNFTVSRVSGGENFPPDADTLVMINPSTDFPTGQAGTVRRWVEDGHTLILAMGREQGDISGGLGGRHPMLRAFDLDLAFTSGYTPTVLVAQPLLANPPVSSVNLPGVFSLRLPVTGTVVLASSRNEQGAQIPLAAMVRAGSGRVFVLSTDYPFSNSGIGDAGNGAFVYNLLQMAGGKRVAFDEAHHGVSVGGDIVSLLTGNPWGWALIYGVLLAGGYIMWSARRLGPALPVPTPDQRRPTSEYVTSVARLFRRARKPGYAAERYLQFFKRTLSRYAELDPYLTDTRFVQSLGERGRHEFNQEEMLRAIERLRQLEGNTTAGDQDEFETVKAIRRAEQVRQQALGIRGAEDAGVTSGSQAS